MHIIVLLQVYKLLST